MKRHITEALVLRERGLVWRLAYRRLTDDVIVGRVDYEQLLSFLDREIETGSIRSCDQALGSVPDLQRTDYFQCSGSDYGDVVARGRCDVVVAFRSWRWRVGSERKSNSGC